MEFMLTTVRLLALDEALLYKLGDDSLAGKFQKTCSVRGGGRARISTVKHQDQAHYRRAGLVALKFCRLVA